MTTSALNDQIDRLGFVSVIVVLVTGVAAVFMR